MTDSLKLEAAYAKIDPYQPLYGIQNHAHVLRKTADRCEAIYKYFNDDVTGLKFLDVGCNAGYVSFYLANHDAKVTGWDYSANNIEVCNDLKSINGLAVNFELRQFDLESINKLKQNEYDAVIILNVLHRIINEKGLEYVQDCMQVLLTKIPLLIVELAHKGEFKDVGYYETAPADPLAVFSKVKNIKLDKIGDFETHQQSKLRPMYAVTT